jgi:hypothetical protein
MREVQATTYQQTLARGRTKPCVFLCEAPGTGDDPFEVVVKLKAGIDQGATGSAAELLASLLARQLDVPVPEPMLVAVDPGLADGLTDPTLCDHIRRSAGVNFGCRLLTGGYETWPVGKAIPVALRQTAAELFAFDVLIQNPDRRRNKPNLLWRGDELYAIDHEAAFSFVYDVLGMADTHDVSSLPFLKDHVFFDQLRGREHDLSRFAGALDTVSDSRLNEIMGAIPNEWQSTGTASMRRHLGAAASSADQFVEQVRRVLG